MADCHLKQINPECQIVTLNMRILVTKKDCNPNYHHNILLCFQVVRGQVRQVPEALRQERVRDEGQEQDLSHRVLQVRDLTEN